MSASNGDADIEKRLVNREGRRGWDELRGWHGRTYITVCKIR